MRASTVRADGRRWCKNQIVNRQGEHKGSHQGHSFNQAETVADDSRIGVRVVPGSTTHPKEVISDQKQRWLATALLDLEPQLRRVKNYRALPLWQRALHQHTEQRKQSAA